MRTSKADRRRYRRQNPFRNLTVAFRSTGCRTRAPACYDTIKIYRNMKDQPGNYYLVDALPHGTHKLHRQQIRRRYSRYGESPKSKRTRCQHVTGTEKRRHIRRHQLRRFVSDNGTLEFTGSKGVDGGLDLATKSLTIDDSTTIQDLINFMQQSLGIQITSPDPDNPLSGTPGGSLTATTACISNPTKAWPMRSMSIRMRFD